jgi:flagellar FliJ protein
MTRTEKLAPVVEHVEKNTQTALQAVAFSQRQLQQQQLRLQQLLAYRDEYAGRHGQGNEVQYQANQLKEFNRFMHQLDDTIQQQQQVVAMAERELEVKRQKWKLSQSRSDAMHKMVDRLQEHEQHQERRSEQKTMDEFALRNALKSS